LPRKTGKSFLTRPKTDGAYLLWFGDMPEAVKTE
jgi:hypothetical protein